VTETKVAIGQVKRDISELVNRVAYGGEKIVLTSFALNCRHEHLLAFNCKDGKGLTRFELTL